MRTPSGTRSSQEYPVSGYIPVGAIASVETNSRGPGTTPRAIAVFRSASAYNRAFGAQVAKRGEPVHERDPGRRGARKVR